MKLLGLSTVGLVVGSAALLIGARFLNPTSVLPDLPPLIVEAVDGQQAVRIDSNALQSFSRRYQLPEVPDLCELSLQAARDIHNALQGVVDRPNDASSIGQLGRVFHSHQFPTEALHCYSRARVLAPEDYQWAYYVGRIHADRYEYESAIQAYRCAAQLNPEYSSTFLALGNLFLQTGATHQAQQAFQRFVELSRQSSHGYLGLAQIEFDAQRYRAAVSLLTKALALNKRDFRAHNLLGQSYQHLGELMEARRHLAIVKNLDSQDRLTKQVLFDDPLYHKVLACNTTDAALTERMRAAMATNQPAIAVQLGEELCRRNPHDAAGVLKLAAAYKAAKRYSDALNCAEKAISLDPRFLEALITKAQLLMIVNRLADALELLDEIVKQDPNNYQGQYYRGTAQVLAKQYESAVSSFRHAVRLRQDSARAHVALAEALSLTGRTSEALDEYRAALHLDPENDRALQEIHRLEH